MPLDAKYLSALLAELTPELIGAKIDKIRQPERDEIILALRGDTRRNLLISTGAADARLHFTDAEYENPAAPPMFCMLLRKHISGARITEVFQPEGERAVIFSLAGFDTLGEPEEKRLAVELMGRNSNIILIDAEGIIIDCFRRVDTEMSPRRPVLPGLAYHLPPQPERGNLGFSPLIAREIEYRGSDAFLSQPPVPTLLREPEGKLRDFAFCEILQYERALECVTEQSFSALLERFYTRRAAEERSRSRSSALVKTVKNALSRAERRVASQREELAAAGNREYARECGDIITANIHRMYKGDEILVAEDFYNGGEREIPLDIRKTPQANAAKYYKDYTRAKNAERILTEQIAAGEREADYLQSVVAELNLIATERELDDIRRELIGSGYVKPEKTQSRQKVKPTAPRRFTSTGGAEILVGRNNTQNDELTFKAAFKTDIWLHVKARHGSHVILRTGGNAPADADIAEAASLAAYYSEAREDTRAAVDYCPVKYVKKTPGAKPGMVIYTDYKTVAAAPREPEQSTHG
ncbi:MAG: NFACT family protein [Oscillospiraceae bacterium]|jgi:predicted ribosome quality control (RQC) complex YloA/Tae2 family protein|nr:NFACT family protein [Oscillospiraceae bacterium]